ncbi:MAG: hypothetical protein ABR538_09060 [Candidatus Binatia bacterium]
MFLREALLRCSQLEEEVAALYDHLQHLPAANRETSARWSERSRKERERSRLLHALAELSSAIGDDGPFLVQEPQLLHRLRQSVDEARRLLARDGSGEGIARCVQALDSSPCLELYAGLLDIAQPEARRLLRRLDCEIRNLRRVPDLATRPRSGSVAAYAGRRTTKREPRRGIG